MARPPIRPQLTNRFTDNVQDKPDTPEVVIAKGRMLAEKNVRTFIPALRASNVIIKEDLPTVAAIDRWWRTYWNPDAVMWLVRAAESVSAQNPCAACGAQKHNKYAYVAGIWVHEVGHCVFQHYERMEEGGFANDFKWNLVTDFEMNDDIPGMGKAAASDSGQPIAMCLPKMASVMPEERKLWRAVGMKDYQKITGKKMWVDMFYPAGAGPAGSEIVPFLAFPDQAPMPDGSFLKLPDGLIAENYYEQLPSPKQESKPQSGDEGQGEGGKGKAQGGEDSGDSPGSGKGQGQGPGVGEQELHDHGSGSGGDQRPYEEGDPDDGDTGPGVSEAETTSIRKDVAERIQKEATNGRGTQPAGWVRWATNALKPPRVRWERKLKAMAQQAFLRVAGERYSTYRRLSRTSINTRKDGKYRIIQPVMYDTVPVIVIVVDTSGSMGVGERSRLERALSECEGILKLSKCKSYFLDCDANVYGKAQDVKSVRQARVNGGGGTDMRIGVRAAKASKPKADIIVLLTDGDTPWPSEAEVRGTKMITAICNERETAVNDVPKYMNPVWVDVLED